MLSVVTVEDYSCDRKQKNHLIYRFKSRAFCVARSFQKYSTVTADMRKDMKMPLYPENVIYTPHMSEKIAGKIFHTFRVVITFNK